MYVLAWPETREHGLEDEGAEEFVRRCEVVAAGVHQAHAHHERRLSAAHGEDLLPRLLSGDTLDVAAAAGAEDPERLIVDPGDLLRELGVGHCSGAGRPTSARSGLRSGSSGTSARATSGQEPVHPTDRERIAELVARYRETRLGTVDASVIAAAERLGITAVATRDRRRFSVVRPRHVEAFALPLPESRAAG